MKPALVSNELLNDIHDTSRQFLIGQGMPEDKAAALAVNLIEHIITQHGGTSFYVTKKTAEKLNDRNARLLADFNSGIAIRELARKYNLGDRQIRSIVDKFEN